MDLYRPVADGQTDIYITSGGGFCKRRSEIFEREAGATLKTETLSRRKVHSTHEKIGSRPAHYSYEQQEYYYDDKEEEYYDIFTQCDFVGGASRSVVNHGADER